MKKPIEDVSPALLNGPFRHYTLITSEPWTEEDAKAYQVFDGYPPEGYNFEHLKVVMITKHRYHVSWRCYSSCD